ncbi:hypothetical protein ZWY2020_020478 [Hordeum vulgare]|nr:hypothetical protein ZWY2020_020478 [Hordeum vulgare]
MSSTSCLAPLAPRLPCARVRLPPPSAAAERPSLRFKPRGAAPTKGWRLVHLSCFRQDQDVSTTSDDGTGFKYNEQAEISGDPDLEEDGGSPNTDDQNYVNGDWFVRAQKMKENLQETIFRFWNGRWAVPWTGQTIAQVMFLWIATFWLVGSWIVPFLAHAAGFSKETLTHRGQALYSLVTDITEGLAGIAILHQCLVHKNVMRENYQKIVQDGDVEKALVEAQEHSAKFEKENRELKMALQVIKQSNDDMISNWKKALGDQGLEKVKQEKKRLEYIIADLLKACEENKNKLRKIMEICEE